MTGQKSIKERGEGSIRGLRRLKGGRSSCEEGLPVPFFPDRDSLSFHGDVSAREPGTGSLSVRAANRNSGGGLGGLHECVEAGRRSWWGTAGQAEVGENLDDHGGILDGCQDGQRPAAQGTGGQVDREDAFESLGPTHSGPRGGRARIVVPLGGVRLLVWVTGHDLRPERRVGCEHAMEANEMEARTRDERGQALKEFQRGHDEMGGAIAVEWVGGVLSL